MIPILISAVDFSAWIILFLSGIVLFRAVVFYRRKKKAPSAGAVPEEFAHLIEEYEVVNKNLPVGTAIFSPDGSLREYNEQGKKLLEIISGDDLKNFNPLQESSCLNRAEILRLKNRENIDKRIAAGGFHIRLMIYPVSESDDPVLLLLISDDTDIVNRRKENENTNAVFNQAMAESRIGVCRLNLFDNRGYANDAWYRNLGAGAGSAIIDSFNNIVPGDKELVFRFIRDILNIQLDEKEYIAFMENREAGKILNINIRINESGKLHWLRLHGELSEYNPEEGRIILNIITLNIDRQMEREALLEKAYRQATEAEQLKIAFIANMSQEIKEPLNSVILYSEQLTAAQDKEEEKRLFARIEKTNAVLLKLITDIINISKIESGSMTLLKKEIGLNAVFEETISEYRTEIRPGVKMIFSPTINLKINSDREKIQRILSCFLLHAVKNTREGFIETGYQISGDNLYLYVKDSAPRIPLEKRLRLFNEFNGSQSYSKEELGDVLSGLYLKMLKGAFGFESDEKGTISWCRIPVREDGVPGKQPDVAGLNSKIARAADQMPGGKNPGKKTLLLAEDNENNFQLIRYMLKDHYNILHACNGSEAVELYHRYVPDLILMDIKMPVMDGYEAVAKIRETDRSVPIIAVTAFVFDKEKGAMEEKGFNACISKPVNESQLLEILNRFLHKNN